MSVRTIVVVVNARTQSKPGARTKNASLGELERAREYYAKAFELREHASELEKLRITADYYQSVTGELDKAAEAFQEEIERATRGYPQHMLFNTRFGLIIRRS